MSVAFIPVEDWANQTQDLIGFNELVLAYSERRQTLGQSAVDPLTAGVSGFDKTLCLAMQEWCEANCTSFVDHVSGPLNAGGTDFLYFTRATWRAAAGLHADGFRRRVEPGDADSYGTIEVGDARGDWCFEDLQEGFSVLRWTTRTPGSSDQQYKYVRGSDAWPSSWTSGALYSADYVVRARVAIQRYAFRQRGKATLSNISSCISHSVDVYLKPTIAHPTLDQFYDIDSYGMVENELFLILNIPSSQSESHITDWIGNIPTEPTCPAAGPPYYYGLLCAPVGWLLKWEPTNQG